MERKHNVNEINLEIDKINFWGNGRLSDGGIRFSWSADIGIGQVDIVKANNGSIQIFSEGMDEDDNKEFTKKLVSLLLEQAKVVD